MKFIIFIGACYNPNTDNGGNIPKPSGWFLKNVTYFSAKYDNYFLCHSH